MAKLNLKDLIDLEVYMLCRAFMGSSAGIELNETYSEEEQHAFEELWAEVAEENKARIQAEYNKIAEVECKKKDMGMCNMGFSMRDPTKFIGCEKLRKK